ncbi:MAG: hypothetical protein IT577_12235 [Verrucomicrobiae bacterium]|nr:hypothetical protein [Verrucomicrobiae bacterium]
MIRKLDCGWGIGLGAVVEIIGVAWLWSTCGHPSGMGAARAILGGSFDRFDAAMPLSMALSGAAIWMIAVPAGQAMRRREDGRVQMLIAGCLVPLAGCLLAHWVVGGLVARGSDAIGWSPWQDVVAQFCLPVGGLAAVACGSMALGARDEGALACWWSGSSGGLALMALGRADDGGLSVALFLALAQWVVVGIWVLVGGPGGRASGWRAWATAGCAASLAGAWPLPGGLARWRLLEEMCGGGFGMAWDRALLLALVLSWALAVVACAARMWHSLARKLSHRFP